MHYHHFMFFVHEELKRFANSRNPLEALVAELATPRCTGDNRGNH
jgi:cell division protein ZapE